MSRLHASCGVSSIGPASSFDFGLDTKSLVFTGDGTGEFGTGAEGGGSFDLLLAVARNA